MFTVPTYNMVSVDSSGDEQTQGIIQFQVTRDITTSAGAVTIDATGTAFANTDYSVTGNATTPVSNVFTATFASGASTATITLTPLRDNLKETSESIHLTLRASEEDLYNVGTSTFDATIQDDPPTVTVSVVGSTTLTESGATTGTLRFVASGGLMPEDGWSVAFVVSGTATPNVDFLESPTWPGSGSQTVLFTAGNTTKDVSFTVKKDNVIESSETVKVDISSGNYVIVGSTSTTFTIQDDPPVVSFAAIDSAGSEADSDVAVIRASRSGGNLSTALSFQFDLSGTAVATDYIVTPLWYGDLDYYDNPYYYSEFGVGIDHIDFQITPKQDALVEGTENVVAVLRTNSSYNRGNTTAEVTIADDPIHLSVKAIDALAVESTANQMVFEFTRSGGNLSTSLALTFNVSGTATESTDYYFYSGLYDYHEILFAAGVTSVQVVVRPYTDSISDSGETVILTIPTNATKYIRDQASATGYIYDTPPTPPVVSIEATRDQTHEKSTGSGNLSTGMYRVYFAAPLLEALTITIEVSGNDLQIPDPDYQLLAENQIGVTFTLTFAAGQFEQTIELKPIDDTDPECFETVTLTLQPALGGPFTIGTSSATVTILDDDCRNPDGSCAACGTAAHPATGDPGTEAPNLTNDGHANPHPYIDFTVANPRNDTVTSVKVVWSVDGGSTTTLWYTPEGGAVLSGEDLRLIFQSDNDLPTGQYLWNADVTYYNALGASTEANYMGSVNVVNWKESPYGNRWNVLPNEQAFSSDRGLLIVLGDGNMVFYAKDATSGAYASDNIWHSSIEEVDDTFERVATDGLKSIFDLDTGRLLRQEDRFGNWIEYEYDILTGGISETEDSAGRIESYSYVDGLLDSYTTYTGITYSYTYDDGFLASITTNDPDGGGPGEAQVTQYEYDPVTGLITSVTDAEGRVNTLGYNAARALTSQVLPCGCPWGYDTPLSHYVPGVADGDGTNLDPIELPGTGDLTGTRTPPGGGFQSYTVDAIGRITSETDELGRTTYYQRDRQGNVTQITSPDPDGAGPLTASVTTFTYDAMGNLLTLVAPDGGTQIWTYEQTYNQVTSYTDELGHVTLFTLNGLGLATSVRQVVGAIDSLANGETDDVVTTYSYSAAPVLETDPPGGLVVSMTDALGRVTTLEYNHRGLVTEVTRAVGTVDETNATYEYDSADLLTASIDEIGRRTEFTYDALNRLILTTLPDPDTGDANAAPTIQYSYDRLNRVVQTIDPIGRVTSYAYEDVGRRVVTTTPDHDGDSQPTTTIAQHDSRGRLVSFTDELGRVATYAYNYASELLSTTLPDPDGAGPLTNPIYSYEYDYLGRIVTSIAPAAGTDTTPPIVENELEPISLSGSPSPTTFDLKDVFQDARDPDTSLRFTIDSNSEPNLIESVNIDAAGVLTIVWAAGAVGTGTLTLRATDTSGNSSTTDFDFTVDLTGSPATPTGSFVLVSTSPDDELLGPVDHVLLTFNHAVNPTSFTLGDILSLVGPNGSIAPTSIEQISLTQFRVIFPAQTATGVYTLALASSITNVNGVSIDQDLDSTPGEASDDQNLVTFEIVEGQLDPVHGSSTQYVYDSAGRIIEVIDARNERVVYTYDEMGKLTSETNQLGQVTTYAYDDLNRLTHIYAPLSTTTEFVYDKVNNLRFVVDPRGATTEYQYDNLNRLVSIVYADPDGAGPLDSPAETFVYDDAGQLVSYLDPLGRETTYSYDGLGRLITLTGEDPDGVGGSAAPSITYAYDDASRLTSVVDPLGRVTAYEYDAHDNLVEVTLPDPDGAGGAAAPVWTFTFDDAGQMLTETDPLSRTTTFAYDRLGRLISQALPDPDGVGGEAAPVWGFSYDLVGNLLSKTDPLDRTTNYEYDELYRVTAIVDALEGRLEYDYDAASQLIASRDKLNRETSYEYDDLGRVQYVTLPSFQGPTGPESDPIWQYGYDENGNVTSVTDPLYRTTTYEYDLLNRLTGIEDHLDGRVEYDYDDASQIVAMRDQLDRETTYQYDGLGRLIEVTLPDPDAGGVLSAPVWQYGYDLAGNQTSVTDPRSNTTAYVYDGLDRLTTVTQPNPDGNGSPITSYVYDVASQLTSVNDPLNRTTTYAYDGLGRLTSETDEMSEVTSYTYDALGNVLTITDALLQVTEFEYDELYRRTAQIDALEGETSFTYDAVGNLLSLTDPEDNTTTWQYDGHNNVKQETNELSQTRTFGYDALGNLLQKTDRNNRVTQYQYDELYRLTDETWFDEYSSQVYTAAFDYDAAGQLLLASDNFSTYAYVYDLLGRVTEIDNYGTPSVPNVVLTQTFDAANNRLSISAEIDSTADYVNEYTFDALNRMTQVTQAGQLGGNAVDEKRVDFASNKLGQFAEITRYADLAGTTEVVTSTFGYDALARLDSLTHEQISSTTLLASYTWSYDEISRITQQISQDGTVDYDYDDTNQLTGADHSLLPDEAYTYDANGNRTLVGYVTGPNNQLLSDCTYDYTYDNEGNRIRREHIASGEYETYTWDHHNRLVSVQKYDEYDVLLSQVDYTYDVFDRRISRTADADGAGLDPAVTEHYVYDGDHIALVFDGSGDLTNRYLHGPAIDQILADEQLVSGLFDQTLWMLTDHLGTVRDIADDMGAVVNHIQYDSFGMPLSETNGSINHRFGFTGREFDELTGLQYNRARYYDSAIGSWVSEDPIGFAGEQFNISSYVRNNPVTHTDPSGLFQERPPEGSAAEPFGNFKFNLDGLLELRAYAPSDLLDVVQDVRVFYDKSLPNEGKFNFEHDGKEVKIRFECNQPGSSEFNNGLFSSLAGTFVTDNEEIQKIVGNEKDIGKGFLKALENAAGVHAEFDPKNPKELAAIASVFALPLFKAPYRKEIVEGMGSVTTHFGIDPEDIEKGLQDFEVPIEFIDEKFFFKGNEGCFRGGVVFNPLGDDAGFKLKGELQISDEVKINVETGNFQFKDPTHLEVGVGLIFEYTPRPKTPKPKQ